MKAEAIGALIGLGTVAFILVCIAGTLLFAAIDSFADGDGVPGTYLVLGGVASLGLATGVIFAIVGAATS